ncbi:hypothetical protein D3C76_677370 [compost metagenome]
MRFHDIKLLLDTDDGGDHNPERMSVNILRFTRQIYAAYNAAPAVADRRSRASPRMMRGTVMLSPEHLNGPACRQRRSDRVRAHASFIPPCPLKKINLRAFRLYILIMHRFQNNAVLVS